MQKEAARKLVQDTFERAFDKGQFKKFVKELLNHLEDAPFTYRGDYIYKDFRDSVKTLERIGKFEDSDGKKIDVLIVNLIKTPSLERARSKQRNFVAKYLKGSRGNELKDGALVAFVSPDEQDWRFSFVKMEYKFDTTKKGQPKVTEQFTPARRYSFLVGENERSHTAQSRLLPILENTDHDPTLAEIEEAFSIEKVTKEFFENYRLLFHEIKDALDEFVKKDKATKADFQEKGVDTVDFAKKLIGQIVFLYFLQKKGWFGVARKEDWGTGPKNFLRLLFEGKMSGYDNFFNDILEPLFYEALAVERQADYYSPFKCKIPFLNGGLFDPLNDYDWVHTDILIPDEFFSNKKKTKQGDTGTGILDVFDRYNFTVKEDEPLEKEVAIDPEMLGKVFENLLEVKDRKSKGTYYTPREIVHYMCQESLINYLVTELKEKIKREDIETLIKHGDAIIDHEQQVLRAGKETTRYPYRLSPVIRDSANVIDKKLADIKVCDPAVGSGAFLVGMMSEIVRTRSVLTRINNPDEEPNIYDFKRDAIQDSLHGVDIDLGAVEIAKLRLWLSLIVDEEDYKHIKPLPNLDYKIMQGNSLLEEYEGIKLIDERFFEKHEEKEQVQKRLKEQQSKWQREYFDLHSDNKLTPTKKSEIEKNLKSIEKRLKALEQPKPNGQDAFDIFGQTDAQSKANELLELHERFFNAHHKSDKDRIHNQINKLTWNLIETTLKQKGKEDKLEDVKRFQRTNTSPFFLWKLNFAEIFRENSGFDVVIANPPYVSATGLSNIEKSELKRNYQTAIGRIDTYGLFTEKAILLASERGCISYIVPNKFLTNLQFKYLRKLILDSCRIVAIAYPKETIFKAAAVNNVIFVLQRNAGHSENNKVCIVEIDQNVRRNKFMIDQDVFERDSNYTYLLSFSENISNIKKKIEDNSVALSVFCDVKDGIIAGRIKDKLFVNRPVSKNCKRLVFGDNMGRYRLSWSGTYVDYRPEMMKKEERRRIGADKGLGLRLRVPSVFETPKILTRKTADCIIAAYDSDGYYFEQTLHGIIAKIAFPKLEFILAILNSKLYEYYYRNIVYQAGTIFPQVRIGFLKQLPIYGIDRKRSPEIEMHDRIVSIVNQILSLNKNSQTDHDYATIRECECQIDQLVYKLYDLTPEEIAIVEGANKKG